MAQQNQFLQQTQPFPTLGAPAQPLVQRGWPQQPAQQRGGYQPQSLASIPTKDIYQRVGAQPSIAQNNGQQGLPNMPQGAVGQPSQPPMPEGVFNDPVAMVAGGLGGYGAYKGMGAVFNNNNFLAKDGNSLIHRVAHKIDRAPGINRVSDAIGERIRGWDNETAQTLLRRTTPEKVQQEMIRSIVANAGRKFPAAKEQLEALGEQATTLEELQKGIVENHGLLKAAGVADNVVTNTQKYQDALRVVKNSTGPLSGKTEAETIEAMKSKLADALNKAFPNAEGKISKLLSKAHAQTIDGQAQTVAGFEEALRDPGLTKKLIGHPRKINGLLKFIKGQQNSLTSYQAQYDVLKTAGEKTGPVGRVLLSVAHHVRGVFGGEMMKGGMGKGWFAHVMEKGLPVLMGIQFIGSAVTEAKKGDTTQQKVSGFFHNFLGTGVGSMVGWAVTRPYAKALFDKLAKGATLKSFLRFASVGGAVPEMLAMFVLSIPFKKGLELLSDTIFGKPKAENKNAPPMQPAKILRSNNPNAVSPFQQEMSSFLNQSQPQPAVTPPPPQATPSPVTPSGSIPFDVIRQNTAGLQAQQDERNILNQPGWGNLDMGNLVPKDLIDTGVTPNSGGH